MKNNISPAKAVAMMRPAAFGFNEQTATNNFFQDKSQKNNAALQQKALIEFDDMVMLLRSNGIEVLILQDNAEPVKPDAIFPNNWFSCMDDRITIFPMCAINRRAEKRSELIKQIKTATAISNSTDLSSFEQKNIFLEGTGSMLIDHRNRMIYACISERTNEILLKDFAASNNYQVVSFTAADEQGRLIYHTNVMMCIGDHFAVVCLDAIDKNDREAVVQELTGSNHEIIEISFKQMNSFAGNMLQLMNDQDQKLLVMSKTAFQSLSATQIKTLEKYTQLITPDVSSIENAGGGSVRCMMAELFCQSFFLK